MAPTSRTLSRKVPAASRRSSRNTRPSGVPGSCATPRPRRPRAGTLVLAPSTFSWWAAWLSEAEVHVPLLGVLAHQRTVNYPIGPGNRRVRGGLRCGALFEDAGKSLAVDDARFVYHDMDSARFFGRYLRGNESFVWGEVG